MADQSTKECSQLEAKYCESTPLLEQQVDDVHALEILEACRGALREITSALDEDTESGLGSETALDAFSNSSESLCLSQGKFRVEFLALLDSTGSSGLQVDEEQLRTQVIPSPPQPLSKQDELVKGSADTGFEDLEERFETEERERLIPDGSAQEPPVPPRQPGSPSDGSNKPNRQSPEMQQNQPWLRNLRVRTVAALTDRAFKYVSLSVLCVVGCMACCIAAVVLNLDKFHIWSSITVAITIVLGFLGAVLFCAKAANQIEQDDAERFATSRRENIQYEIISDRAFLDLLHGSTMD